jgi:DNA-directed RNA polymerase specialized sigma24 family protein
VAETPGPAATGGNPTTADARNPDDMELVEALPASLRADGRVSARPAIDPSDADLLQRIARGDRGAFELLYSRYARAVLSLALRLLRDRGHGEDAPSPERGPAERAEQSWLSWRVHRAIAELPERERVALELAYWSGLSQSEIAEHLDVPLGTVKTRTRAALARLAQMLEGEEL